MVHSDAASSWAWDWTVRAAGVLDALDRVGLQGDQKKVVLRVLSGGDVEKKRKGRGEETESGQAEDVGRGRGASPGRRRGQAGGGGEGKRERSKSRGRR